MPLTEYDIYNRDLLCDLHIGNESEAVVQGLLAMCLERLFSLEDAKTLRGMVAKSDDWSLWASILQKIHGLKTYIKSLPDPPRITFCPPTLLPILPMTSRTGL